MSLLAQRAQDLAHALAQQRRSCTCSHPDRPTLSQLRAFLLSCYPQAADFAEHADAGLAVYAPPEGELYHWREFAKRVADLLESQRRGIGELPYDELTRAESVAVHFQPPPPARPEFPASTLAGVPAGLIHSTRSKEGQNR